MGFSPLKLRNPLQRRSDLSLTAGLSRNLKDAAKNVQMFLPNLRKQVLSKDPTQKSTPWVEPGRKAERNAIRARVGLVLLDAYRSTLGGNHQANEKSYELEMVAERVMARLEQEGRIPKGSLETFKGTYQDFVIKAPDEQRRRLPLDDTQARLCQTSIAEAWVQAGLADEAWLVRKALDTYQGALNSNDPAQKKHASAMQKAAEKVIRELETEGHVPQGSLQTFKGNGTSFVEDTPANQRLRLPSHGAQAALAEVLIGQAWRKAGLVPDAMAYLDKTELTVGQVKAHYGLPEVGFGPTVHERVAAEKAAEAAAAAEAKEAMERVDTAMATYSLVVEGARPEGSTETLDNDQLHAVACGAMFQLRLEGRIAPEEFDRFASEGGAFLGNNEREYAKRFPQGGPDGLLTRELCQATVGEAWHCALLAQKGEPKPITREAVAAWDERGDPLLEELPPITPRVEVEPANPPQEPTPPDVPVPDPLPAKGPTVPVPAPLTLEQKMAQVDTALATYGLVLVGERPEGSTQSLDKHALHVLAISAMTKLVDEGWITPTDLKRFVAQEGSIVGETRAQRAQRFPQGIARNVAQVRELCEAAIGYAWDGALRGAADGPRAKPEPETIFTPETIRAWNRRGAPAQPVVPVASVGTADAAAVPAPNGQKPVVPVQQPLAVSPEGAKQLQIALRAYEAGVNGQRVVGSAAAMELAAAKVIRALEDAERIESGAHMRFTDSKHVSEFVREPDAQARDKRLPQDPTERLLVKAAIGQAWIDFDMVKVEGARKQVKISPDMLGVGPR